MTEPLHSRIKVKWTSISYLHKIQVQMHHKPKYEREGDKAFTNNPTRMSSWYCSQMNPMKRKMRRKWKLRRMKWLSCDTYTGPSRREALKQDTESANRKGKMVMRPTLELRASFQKNDPIESRKAGWRIGLWYGVCWQVNRLLQKGCVWRVVYTTHTPPHTHIYIGLLILF